LDASLNRIVQIPTFTLPKFATVAISDACLRLKPSENQLLRIIVDAVSAREGLDGVYLVVEQAGEAPDTRSCGSERTLSSLLHLVHAFANDAGLRVGVNFIGPFGLVCEAVGAEWWATNWYVSLRRLRLADKVGKGRSFPLFWSYPCALDIHMDKEFDKLVNAGHLMSISETTPASAGLLTAAASGRRASQVPAWSYRQSNVSATKAHYLGSAISRDAQHGKLSGSARLDHVERWLADALTRTKEIEAALGPDRKTNTQHVQPWLEALRGYRTLHNV
jgi:hypothetical protein